MEHRRLELLTPTLPVLCATNCANAPQTLNIISYNLLFVKGGEKIFVERLDSQVQNHKQKEAPINSVP